MGSSETTSPPPGATEQPVKQSAQPPESKGDSLRVVDMILRVFLFTAAVVAIIVVVNSKQTKMIPVSPGVSIPVSAKFNYMPSFIYLITALSVACLYVIITGALLVLAIRKPGGISTKLQFHVAMLDTLLLGIVVSATGAGMGVSYIGFKGNSRSGWNKICNTYDSFCFQSAAFILLSFISSITLLLLVWLSIYVIYKKTTRR